MTDVMAIKGFELISQDEMVEVDGGSWSGSACAVAAVAVFACTACVPATCALIVACIVLDQIGK